MKNILGSEIQRYRKRSFETEEYFFDYGKKIIKERLRRKIIKKQLEKKLELHTPETLEEKVNKALPMGVRAWIDLVESYDFDYYRKKS